MISSSRISSLRLQSMRPDARCERYEAGDELVGIECRLGTASEATLMPIGAIDANGSATYTRPGSSRPYRITWNDVPRPGPLPGHLSS